MTGKGHLQQDHSEEAPSPFQPMMTTSFLAQTTPVTTFVPLSSYSPNVAEKSRALVEELPGISSLQLHLGPQPLSPMVSTGRPPRPANLRQDFPPIPGQDSKTYAGTASDSSNEQPKGPIPDLPVKIFSANATDVQPSSSRPNPFTSSTPTRSSSLGTANQAPRNGSKRLTKPLLPSSERKTQQRNGHNEELWDWDIVPSPAPLETPLNASESDSSRPMNSDVADLRDQQIDYILRTLRRLESSQEQHSQRQKDISNYLTRFNRWISGAPVFGSPDVSYQGQPVPGYTGQPAFVTFPTPAQISPAVTGAPVFEPPAQPFGIPGAPSSIVPGAPAPFIPPQAVGQPFGILPDQPSSIMENWPVPFIPPGVASSVTGQQPMPFIPQPVTKPAAGPGSSHSSIAFYRPSSTPRTGHPIVIQQPPGPTGGIQPPAIIRIPSNRSDSRIPSPHVSQYTGVALNAPVARDPIIIQQPTGIRPLEGVADISDSRTLSPHVDQHIGVVLTDSVERHQTIIQLPPVSPGIQPPTIIRIGDSRMPSPSGSTGMRPPMVIHIPSNKSDSSTPSSVRARRILSVESAPAEYPTVLQQPTGIRPLEGVADISDSRTPSSRVSQSVLLVESGPVASHRSGQPAIASTPYTSASYPLASSAKEIERNGRYRRARPIRTGLPFIRRFSENELQMHAFEGKDQATMGILSEAGRMIAVKPVNFASDGGGHASESAIMDEFDDWLRLWGSLRHDNIAELVGSVFFNGIPSVITYRVASGNVEDYLKGNPQADRPNLSNILVENGRVELGDIGILEFLEMKGVGAEMHGKTGDVRWTAPEVLEGPDRQWWSDVYSFGCLALFILRDEIPYSTLETDVAVSKAIYRGDLPVNRDAASRLHPTWKLCWSHDPKRRPNMRTVLESLEDW
ncbi:hypothetical protein FRC04_012234 [Tulasnella sp. 424]|nr:hypothetical protein FRC04_012234 [Tulasnella sp. 424]